VRRTGAEGNTNFAQGISIFGATDKTKIAAICISVVTASSQIYCLRHFHLGITPSTRQNLSPKLTYFSMFLRKFHSVNPFNG